MKPEYISASRLMTFIMCPRKYHLIYEKKVQWDFHPSNLALGSAVPAAIECYYRSFQDGTRLSTDEMTDLFSGFWNSQIDGKSLESRCNPDVCEETGKRLIETFVDKVQPSTIIAVEEQFTVPVIDRETGEFIINQKGVYDLIEADNNGGVVVVDNKTAAKRPSDNDLEMNL